jgi:hypothetical protein
VAEEQKQTRMPETFREGWLRPSKMVAKTRPDVVKIEGYRVNGSGGQFAHVAYYWHAERMHRVTVMAEPGEDWRDALADALESDYQARYGGQK